ncbi:MAG: ABC transporter permease [Candidatus Hodarchaeales archaeon]|jgi:ABC-2 type transport system permease protein
MQTQLHVYFHNLRRSWKGGIGIPVFVAGFIAMMAAMWPSMQDQMRDRFASMQGDFYKAILGEMGLGEFSWQSIFFMYISPTIQIVMIIVAIFIVRLITTDYDKNRLDVVLSLPIPRWRYILEKYSVFLTFNLLYPVLVFATTIISTAVIGEEIDSFLILNYSIGVWLLLFALGSISLMCGALFLESNKALSVAGLLIVGQYFLNNIGGLLESLNIVQRFSLFYYLKPSTISDVGMLPLGEVFIVLAVGLLALAASLFIFQRRELTT